VKGLVSDDDSLGDAIWYSMSTTSLSATNVLGEDRKLKHEQVIPSFLGNPF
jgi:hypothetical protein